MNTVIQITRRRQAHAYFHSFDDFKKPLAVHNRKYNYFPVRPLNWNSPAHYVNAFLIYGEVFRIFCSASLTKRHFRGYFKFSLAFYENMCYTVYGNRKGSPSP